MPPLTVENSLALVGGISPKEKSMQAPKPPAPPPTLRVRVLRAFQNHERTILAPGTEAVLPRVFALEMHAANKCALLPDALPAQEAPAEQSAEKPRRGSKEK